MVKWRGLREMVVRAAVGSLCLSFGAAAVAAGSAAGTLGVQRYVAQPKLLVNNEPALCESVFADARALFESGGSRLDMGSVRPLLKWGPLSEGLPAPPASLIGRLDLDLDKTGVPQVIIYRDVDSIRRTRAGWVFPSPEIFEAAEKTIGEEWQKASFDQFDPVEPVLGARTYYPLALHTSGGTVATGYAESGQHALFEWRGRYYFFNQNVYYDLPFDPALQVFRLHSRGTVDEVCRIALPETRQFQAQLEHTPGVLSFLKVIRRIGTGGEDCGTAHFALGHDLAAARAEHQAAVRPWIEPGQYNDRTERLLASWSRQELWNWREYQTFRQHLTAAEQGIANYMVEHFGIAPRAARTQSVRVVQEIIGARLHVPSDDDYFESHRSPLNDAIFSRDRGALETAIAEARAKNASPFKDLISAALSNAVEWQFGLQRLLQAGADPNYPNGFGKTPLMVAAHMNRIDSARVLLRAGARADATTEGMPADCGGEIIASGRTPMTYAAENASAALMKLLLDAGATPADSYLERNPRLTAADRASGMVKLVTELDRFRGPSFDCSSARTRAERAICGSDTLRIFDVELARAYRALEPRESGAAASQREWLRQRDRECGGRALQDDDYADCLAEMTRTRIRYLHNRLDEQ